MSEYKNTNPGQPTGVWGWPGLVGGVLTGSPGGVESLGEYRAVGGYGFGGGGDWFERLGAVSGVGLLAGRGGAGFGLWRKVGIVRGEVAAAGRGGVVVANGAEGEPLSVKDRFLMRHRPHLVLDGVRLVAGVVGAGVAYVYVADEGARRVLEGALGEVVGAGVVGFPEVRVVVAQDTFVAGEASAVVRAIDSGVARPVDHPPFPSRVGVGGVPTLVSNVETLARLARLVLPGAVVGESPLLVTVSGSGLGSVLVEVPYGLGVGELLEGVGVGGGVGRDVLVGGFFGGIVPVTAGLCLTRGSLAEWGGALGCGSVFVLPVGGDPLPVALGVADFYVGNNAGQCRSCVEGTRAVALALGGGVGGSGVVVPRLERWGVQLVGRGACATPDGVARLVRSLLRHYPDRLAGFVDGGGGSRVDWRGLRVAVPEVVGCSLVSGGVV